MVAPMQSGVAEAIDGVLNTFGPFVIPVALFAAGVVGYLFLVTIGRAGVEEESPTGGPRSVPDEGNERDSASSRASPDDAAERNSAGRQTQSGDADEETSRSGDDV